MPDAYSLQKQMFPRALMISVGHLTARTARWLQDHDAADWPCLGGHFGDAGFMMFVDEGASGSAPNLPFDISEVFDFAVSKDAAFVIFQDVGPVVPGLQVYRRGRKFEADQFLNRPRKTSQEIDDDAASASLAALATEGNFDPTPDHIIKTMQELAADLAVYAREDDIYSFPLDRLQRFADLATAFWLLSKSSPKEFASAVRSVHQLETGIRDIMESIAHASKGRAARTREALEDIEYWLHRAIDGVDTRLRSTASGS